MTEIKPWNQRNLPDGECFSTLDALQYLMQAEIDELRAALAKSQPVEQGEPVAWINKDHTYVQLSDKATVYGSHTIPLFTHPVRPMSDAPKIYSRCSNTLRLLGKPYPRTCQECGLGPCKDPIKGATE